MALATASSLTSTGGTRLMTVYYDKLFLQVAEEQLVHKQLGQANLKIGSGDGGFGTNKVQWTRWTNLDEITAGGSGEGVPTSAVTLSAVAVTGTTSQFDNAVSISDILAYAGFGDIMKAAVERLAYNAGVSIDSAVKLEVYNSGTAMTAQSNAHYSSMTATGYLTITPARRAVRTLRRNNARPLEDGLFVAVIHPDQEYDFLGDTTANGWNDVYKYAKPEDMLKGEIGKLMGVRYLSSSNGATIANPAGAASGYTASATFYVASYFGRDAFGVTELQGLKTYIKNFGSGGVGDPTDKIATAGWKTTFGTSMLNSAFAVNMYTVVSSTA